MRAFEWEAKGVSRMPSPSHVGTGEQPSPAVGNAPHLEADAPRPKKPVRAGGGTPKEGPAGWL
jgi:hypothetical protein